MKQERDVETLVRLIEPVIRRVVGNRVSNPDLLDDLVQETIAGVVEASPLLEDETLIGYAVISARNAVAQDARKKSRQDSAYARSVEPILPAESAEVALLSQEERYALLSALRKLGNEDRALIYAHHVEGVGIGELAEEADKSTGSIALRLARARAVLRLDYLLAFRHQDLPTKTCRSILLALSSADQRRQFALGAAEHMEGCTVCSELAPTLLKRDRGMTVIAPVGLMIYAVRKAVTEVRQHPIHATAGGAVIAAGVVTTVWLTSPPPATPTNSVAAPPLTTAPAPANPCEGVMSIGGRTPDPSAGAVPASEGDRLTARGAAVANVPIRKGFWLACGKYQLWVELRSSSTLPPQVGQKVNLDGVIERHVGGYAKSQGLGNGVSAERLDNAAYHGVVAGFTVSG